MFGKRKKRTRPDFDTAGKIPVIRSSICTGEQVAGFRDEASGRFQEVMLLRSGEDLREFLELYGIRETEIKREW
ncbi:MAG: aspartate dehydrogenase [Oscillospiraceae bacterium]|nr:aspartate dehydrogenase [Oscillospiraceae bacterium]